MKHSCICSCDASRLFSHLLEPCDDVELLLYGASKEDLKNTDEAGKLSEWNEAPPGEWDNIRSSSSPHIDLGRLGVFVR